MSTHPVLAAALFAIAGSLGLGAAWIACASLCAREHATRLLLTAALAVSLGIIIVLAGAGAVLL